MIASQLAFNLLPALTDADRAQKSLVGTGIRDPRDYYPTPFGLIDSILDLVQGTPQRILDPCYGTGRWGEQARERWPDAEIWGLDLNFDDPHPAYDRIIRADFRAWREVLAGEKFDLLMENPPF